MPTADQILNPALLASADGSHSYRDGALKAIEILKPFLSPKDLTKLETQKLQLHSDKIDETQYLQAACEVTICAYFADKFPSNFQYEPQPTPPKDVDCSYMDGEFLFNVEVKCADFSKKHEIQGQDAFQMGAFGRVPDYQEVFADLAPIMSSGADGKPLVLQQHKDNKLKDFLISAHGKFAAVPDEKALNVLAVCCDDPGDVQKWFGYMYAHEGLFTEQSFAERSQYERVDVVMLTNLFHRHHKHEMKDKLSNHWDLGSAFNLVFSNPKRQLDKGAAILHFLNAVPNYGMELFQYRAPGDIPPEVEAALRVRSFVMERLFSAGLYHFQPPEPQPGG